MKSIHVTLPSVLVALALAGCQTQALVNGGIGNSGPAQNPGQQGTASQDGQPASAQAPQPTNTNTKGAPKTVRVSPSTLVLPKGQKRKLQGTVVYTTGLQDSTITWSSSDDTILAVNTGTGEVTAVREGTASVVAAATRDPAVFATVEVTVRAGAEGVTLVTVDPTEVALAVGDSAPLSAIVKKTDGTTDTNVTYKSSNPSVATVTEYEGLVSGAAPGTATITVTSTLDPTKKATVKVTVTAGG